MDRYDEAIEFLTRYPDELEEAARNPGENPIAGCLFANAGQNLYSYLKQPNGRWLGDPVAIHGDPEHYTAEDDGLTQVIIADDRLPRTSALLELSHLPVLAEYQRRFDKWWNRKFKTLQPIDDGVESESSESEQGLTEQSIEQNIEETDTDEEAVEGVEDQFGSTPSSSEPG